MILDKKSLSMSEASEYIQKDSETDIKGFIKKFASLKPNEAKKLRKKLEGLELMKMREEHISKIIDVLPEIPEELNKIFSDVSLDENESKQVLETIKEFK